MQDQNYFTFKFERLILALIFILIITPIAFTVRLFGRDRLKIKIDPKVDTYRS